MKYQCRLLHYYTLNTKSMQAFLFIEQATEASCSREVIASSYCEESYQIEEWVKS